MQSSSVFSIRVPEDLKEQLEAMAKALDRPRSWVVQRALEKYVKEQRWQIEEIQKSLNEADAGDFASDEEVARVFSKWTHAD
jgi:RHH-type transcriptional regulator, rel operon repressor / antitoxin RelB